MRIEENAIRTGVARHAGNYGVDCFPLHLFVIEADAICMCVVFFQVACAFKQFALARSSEVTSFYGCPGNSTCSLSNMKAKQDEPSMKPRILQFSWGN